MEVSVQGVYDLHVHCGPEPIPRKYDPLELSHILSRAGLAGAVLKSHFSQTAAWAWLGRKHAFDNLYGSIVLNRYVGGINPDAVRGALGPAADGKPCLKVVWMPTLHTAGHINMRKKSGAAYDIPEEWTGGFAPPGRQLLDSIEPISVRAPGVESALKETLELIAAHDLILATGHITSEEVAFLVPLAKAHGVTKIIITHPLYTAAALTTDELKDLAAIEGVYVEQAYALHPINKIPVEAMVEQIRAVGPENTIVTSDMGQSFSPDPPEGLAKFLELLAAAGLEAGELSLMTVDNPKRLLGL